MLEGLEAVEIRLSKVLEENNGFRLDPEYFKKEYSYHTCNFKSYRWNKIKDIAALITNGHTPLRHNLAKGNVKFVTAEFIDDFILEEPNKFILQQHHDKILKRSQITKGDLIFSIKGKIGNAVPIYKDYTNYNINQDVARIALKDPDNIFIAATFLNCKYGKLQSKKLATGQINPFISLGNLQCIMIPEFSEQLKTIIEILLLSSFQFRESSLSLYAEAEQLLLQELDLVNFEPSTENIAIKKLSESFGVTGRLDAEYYQPKYEEILEKIKQYNRGYSIINNFIKNYSTGHPYKSESYQEDGLALIRINNIKPGILDLSNVVNIPFKDRNFSKKDVAKKNDILISMSGTIGNVCKILEDIDAVINQRIMRATVSNFSPDVIVLIINSIVGTTQLSRIGTGGVQTNISSNDIKNLLIPIIDVDIQQQIESKIQQSFTLRKESKRLLDIAKQAVEIAIEEGEEQALNLLENNSTIQWYTEN